MLIQDFNNILSIIPTFTASSISTYATGMDYNYPNAGNPETYPLLFLEQEYNLNVGNPITIETWQFGLLVVDQKDMENNQETKDDIKDLMLIEARKIVSYLRYILPTVYKGARIDNINYLSLEDFEQDNVHGWRLELTITVPNTGETKCNPFPEVEDDPVIFPQEDH